MADIDFLIGLARQECERLAALGSADAIAQHLLERNITGNLNNCYECPLAVALASELKAEPWAVRVEYDEVFVSGNLVVDLEEQFQSLRDFVSRFDAGDYPELEQ